MKIEVAEIFCVIEPTQDCCTQYSKTFDIPRSHLSESLLTGTFAFYFISKCTSSSLRYIEDAVTGEGEFI